MLFILTVLTSVALSALGAAAQPELLFGPGGQMELEGVPEYILAALSDYVPDAPSMSLVTPTTTISASQEPTAGWVIPAADGVDEPAYTIIPNLEQGRLAMAQPQPELITDSNQITTSEIDNIVSSTVLDVASASTSSSDATSVEVTASPTDSFSTDVPSSEATLATTVLDSVSDTLPVDPASATTVLDVGSAASTVVDSERTSSTPTPVATTATHKKHTTAPVTNQSIVRPSGPTRIFGPAGTTIILTKTTSSPSSSPTVALDAAAPQQQAKQRTILAVLIILAIFFAFLLTTFFIMRKRLCCCRARDDEEDDMWVAPPRMAQTASGRDKECASVHVQQLASCTPQLTSIPRVNYERHGGAAQRVHLPTPQPQYLNSPAAAGPRPTPYAGARLTPVEYSPMCPPRFREEQPSPMPVGATAPAPRRLYGLGFTNIGLDVGEVWQGQYATRNY